MKEFGEAEKAGEVNPSEDGSEAGSSSKYCGDVSRKGRVPNVDTVFKYEIPLSYVEENLNKWKNTENPDDQKRYAAWCRLTKTVEDVRYEAKKRNIGFYRGLTNAGFYPEWIQGYFDSPREFRTDSHE